MSIILEKSFSPSIYRALWQVEEHEEGIRLDLFMMDILDTWSREQIKKKIKKGDITILGREHPHRPNAKVHEGEKVEMVTFPEGIEDEYWNGELIEFQRTPEILYEDSDIVVISKPPFMTTHPTGRRLFNCATVFFEDKYKKTVHSIHRLDRETSGVLLLGRNPKAAQKLTAHFENDLVRKCYFWMAVDQDDEGKSEFEANERLGQSDPGLKRVLMEAHPENSTKGKRARTFFKVLHRENGYALGLAFPQTGRQHQIRVHAEVHGYPLVGDKTYLGGYELFQRFKDGFATPADHEFMEIPRQALHAMALRFPYPSKDKKMIVRSPIPHDFKDWIKSKMKLDLGAFEEVLKAEIENYFNKFDK